MGKHWKFALFLLIPAGVAALYGPSLHYPYFFDDIPLFTRNGLNRIFLAGPALDLRWLAYFPMAWIDLIFDDRLFAQRTINLGLHLTTAFVLYSLILQVSRHAAPHRNNERAALAAALLFLLHPLAVYAVGYLAQRTILMATLFGLLALSAYFDGVVTRKKSYFLFSALFYFLSAFSKEHAVLIPAAAFALTPLVAPLSRHTWRSLVLPFGLYLAIAALLVFKRHDVVGVAYEPYADDLTGMLYPHLSAGELWLLSFVTQATLFFKYLALMVVPHPGWMSIDMRVPLAAHPWQPLYWMGLLVLTAYGAVALLLLRAGGRRGLLGYALLAPLLLFAVEFSSIRVQEPFVLYRAYLWLPLLFVAVPALTHAVPQQLFWPALLTIAVLFATASHDRLNSFSSSYALWDDAVRKLPDDIKPGAGRVFSNRCHQHLIGGRLQAAVDDCGRAIQVEPKFKLAFQNRVLAHLKMGNFQAAIGDAETVSRLYPKDPSLFALLGMAYNGAGRIDEARVNLELGCKLNSLAACVELQHLEAKHPVDRSAKP